MEKYNYFAYLSNKTSRCPYCAFGFHCKFTGIRSFKSCHSCQIISFMSNHVIHVKSCHSCQIMSFMSWVIGLFRKFSKVGEGQAFRNSFAVWPKAKMSKRDQIINVISAKGQEELVSCSSDYSTRWLAIK
jgi:hypothetical protein